VPGRRFAPQATRDKGPKKKKEKSDVPTYLPLLRFFEIFSATKMATATASAMNDDDGDGSDGDSDNQFVSSSECSALIPSSSGSDGNDGLERLPPHGANAIGSYNGNVDDGGGDDGSANGLPQVSRHSDRQFPGLPSELRQQLRFLQP
jgi:hypothetical protein